MSDARTIALRDLDSCFQGVVPATLATCSANGCPNLSFLSIARRIGDDHVALSFQFFRKTAKNIRDNPRAALLLVDPATFRQYRLNLSYERTETEGPTFEAMATQLDAVASQIGMKDVFHLKGADVYRVLDVTAIPHDLELDALSSDRDHLAALADMGERLDGAQDLDVLFDTLLERMATDLGFHHSFLLVVDDDAEHLYTVASHGYDQSGVGAEVALGEGILGTAAERRRPVRISHMERARLMAQTIRDTAVASGRDSCAGRDVPLPGLPNVMSQLAVPILHRGKLLGLVCAESARSGAFSADDEAALVTLARMVGSLMPSLSDAGPASGFASGRSYGRPGESRGPQLRVEHYAADDSVFLDGEYLIKGLPGRILRRLLEAHLRDGRTEFSNRELRLDSSLGLSPYRDNLEARLILLRKRLEERSPTLRIQKAGRGRFRLKVECAPELVGHA